MKPLLFFLSVLTILSCADSEIDRDAEIDKILKTGITEMASEFPMQVEADTILVGARLDYESPRSIIYLYKFSKLIKSEFTSKELRQIQETARGSQINYFCSQPAMKLYRDLDVTIEYNYSDTDMNYLYSTKINNLDCAE